MRRLNPNPGTLEELFSNARLFARGEVCHLVTVDTFNATIEDDTIFVDATLDDAVVNLPDVKGFKSPWGLLIKKVDGTANTVTITAASGQDIEGNGTMVLTGQWDGIVIVALNSTTWALRA